jgi:hypothetical protein
VTLVIGGVEVRDGKGLKEMETMREVGEDCSGEGLVGREKCLQQTHGM